MIGVPKLLSFIAAAIDIQEASVMARKKRLPTWSFERM
jgi:hypothetical protein